MKVAIAYLTKDRVELTKQSALSLLEGVHAGHFHMFWMDGSSTKEGEDLAWSLGYPTAVGYWNICGGPGAAMVCALATLLDHPENYTHVGLCENDVLLGSDWFEPTLALFDRGRSDGLAVGAVSARAYEDRVLLQRDGYAVCHNLGAGQILLTREAAHLVLEHYRSGWTVDNRRIFQRLAGVDIANYWAFGPQAHFLTADWHFEAVLAAHGMVALALTPSPVEMIGQVPPLIEQGLQLVTEPVERGGANFGRFAGNLALIRQGDISLSVDTQLHQNEGTTTIFAHQIPVLGGQYFGDWTYCDTRRAPGPFAWKAVEGATAKIPVCGPASFMVSGGERGGTIRLDDLGSGYFVEPELPPEGNEMQVLQLAVPGGIEQRDIALTALSPGVRFFGLQVHEPQVWRKADIGRFLFESVAGS